MLQVSLCSILLGTLSVSASKSSKMKQTISVNDSDVNKQVTYSVRFLNYLKEIKSFCVFSTKSYGFSP